MMVIQTDGRALACATVVAAWSHDRFSERILAPSGDALWRGRGGRCDAERLRVAPVGRYEGPVSARPRMAGRHALGPRARANLRCEGSRCADKEIVAAIVSPFL